MKATLLIIVHRESSNDQDSTKTGGIQSKSPNALYDEGWERIFGKKPEASSKALN